MHLVRMISNSGKIVVNKCDLNLKHVLEGGQSFRWRRVKDNNEWIGVFNGIVWHLTQFDDHVDFTAHPPKSLGSSSDRTKIHKSRSRNNKVASNNISTDVVEGDKSPYKEMLKSYLRLESPLEDYYKSWSENDNNFKEAAVKFHGIRILNQEPVENLFSFICSSNNNIARISMMVEKMCERFGENICNLDNRSFFGFPSVKSLTSPVVEETLRDAGFGYRAKFISSTALKLEKLGGAEYLNSLKNLSYAEAKEQLIQFPGIGPKVADCICLMSLGHFEAVPVDTHVFQVACQSYLPHLRGVKTVTDRVYREIGDHFRELYGPLAGWAHTILFCADLKKFQTSNKGAVEKAKKRKKGEHEPIAGESRIKNKAAKIK